MASECVYLWAVCMVLYYCYLYSNSVACVVNCSELCTLNCVDN